MRYWKIEDILSDIWDQLHNAELIVKNNINKKQKEYYKINNY